MYKILIVEDSATMRSMLSTALEELDVPVKIAEASSGFEALRQLPTDDFDLVVTDINMPDINGLELVSFVKRNERYAGVPLVIVSTEGAERDGSQASCGAGATSPDAVFIWTPAEDATVCLSTVGSSYDTVLHVRAGDAAVGICRDPAAQVACNDDVGALLQSQLTLEASAGTDYFMFVDGFGANSTGDFLLTVSAGACP